MSVALPLDMGQSLHNSLADRLMECDRWYITTLLRKTNQVELDYRWEMRKGVVREAIYLRLDELELRMDSDQQLRNTSNANIATGVKEQLQPEKDRLESYLGRLAPNVRLKFVCTYMGEEKGHECRFKLRDF